MMPSMLRPPSVTLQGAGDQSPSRTPTSIVPTMRPTSDILPGAEDQSSSNSPTSIMPTMSPAPVILPGAGDQSSSTSPTTIMPTVKSSTSVIRPEAGDQSSSISPTNVSISQPFASPTRVPLPLLTTPPATSPPSSLPTFAVSASPTAVVGLPSLRPTVFSGCPNLSVNDRRNALREAVIEVSGEDVLMLPDSSQSQAFRWLADQDSFRACPDDTLFLQRYALAVLYFATLGDQWFTCDRYGNKTCAKESFLSRVDVCLWGGLTCDKSQRLLNINIGKHVYGES
jgi:hypothetical protein